MGWIRPLLALEVGVWIELERFFECGTRGPKGLARAGATSDLTSVLMLMGDVEAGGVGGCKVGVDWGWKKKL